MVGVYYGLAYTSLMIETKDIGRGYVMGWYTPYPDKTQDGVYYGLVYTHARENIW